MHAEPVRIQVTIAQGPAKDAWHYAIGDAGPAPPAKPGFRVFSGRSGRGPSLVQAIDKGVREACGDPSTGCKVRLVFQSRLNDEQVPLARECVDSLRGEGFDVTCDWQASVDSRHEASASDEGD